MDSRDPTPSGTRFGIDLTVENHWDRIAAGFSRRRHGGDERHGYESRGHCDREALREPDGGGPRRGRPWVCAARGPPCCTFRRMPKSAARRPPTRLNDVMRACVSRRSASGGRVPLPLPRRSGRRGEDAGPGSRLGRIAPRHHHGFRDNTIPATAEATLVVRPLPDEDVEAPMQRMREGIDDPAADVVPAGAVDRRTAVRGQHRDVPGPRTGAEALVPAGRHATGHGNRNHRFRPTAGEGRSVLGRLVEFLYNAVVEVDVANQEPHTRDAAFNGTAPVSPARSEPAP